MQLNNVISFPYKNLKISNSFLHCNCHLLSLGLINWTTIFIPISPYIPLWWDQNFALLNHTHSLISLDTSYSNVYIQRGYQEIWRKSLCTKNTSGSVYKIFVHHAWRRDICQGGVYLQGMNQSFVINIITITIIKLFKMTYLFAPYHYLYFPWRL